ncbi:MAG: hypothetical protein IH945_00275 [Armatimonadetes bacterium]|nr:hypothetical protein [Armatimonadota bacterium]
MKWPMIILIAFIASIVIVGCSSKGERTDYVAPEGRADPRSDESLNEPGRTPGGGGIAMEADEAL